MSSTLTLGFLGCGKISSAVCRGYATASDNRKPARIFVSIRSADKSKALKDDFPDLVTVSDSCEEIVAQSDVVFIGLLPGVARELLPTLSFEGKMVISMMAAVDYNEILSLTRCPTEKVVRTVPLPSNARQSGPILMHPPNAEAESLLRIVGTPVACTVEQEMKPLVSMTGHISSFYELLRVTQDFAVRNGVDSATARQFVASFYASMAAGAEQAADVSFEHMREEAATPGGLNEQAIRFLTGSEHYNLAEKSLSEILVRLNGGAKSTENASK